jgi:hypothetical protein
LLLDLIISRATFDPTTILLSIVVR